MKGTTTWWIVVAVVSNAPFSAGLSFGTSHRGSNSSCQQQLFTYLSSQYISLDSIHFTSGIFVSPSLKSLHYVCVLCVYVGRMHIPAVCFSAFGHRCVYEVTVSVSMEKKVFTHAFALAGMGVWSMPGGCLGYTAGGGQ